MTRIIGRSTLDEEGAAGLRALLASDPRARIETEISLNAHRDMRSFFLAYEGASLVGLLSIFAPKPDLAELGAVIRPESRRRGIFGSLLAEAERELLRFGYAEELLVLDASSETGKAAAASLGASYDFTEYAMGYEGGPPSGLDSPLELSELGEESLDELVEMRLAAFGGSREGEAAFARSTFSAPNRKVFAAFLGGRMIGSCSLGFDEGSVGVNAFVIEPNSRGQGYGQAFLGGLLRRIYREGLDIVLEVDSHNATAFHLYCKLGFAVRRSVEYYRRRIERSPRGILLRELAEYRRRNLIEAPTVDRISDFVSSREDAFQRSCLDGHVTGSAFIVDRSFTHTLFVHHVKLGKWLQPGGHCERGETAREAAAREAAEETGIAPRPVEGLGIFDLDVHAIPERPGVPAHYHYDIRYLFDAVPGGESPSAESHAVEWLDFAEAINRNPERSISRPLAKLEALRGGLFS